MTTAYTSLLGLALPVTGELSGTWGDTVNNSITSLLDSAIAGTTTLSADTTLTTTTGASNQARQAILLCSGHVANITITAPAQSKIYTVINTSATYTVKIRGAGPTTGITIPVSSTATVAWNGSDFVDASTYVNGNKVINGNLTVNGNTTLGDASGDSLTINAGTVTLNQGTANGVAYLNGSKVLTTGSALGFDGTNLLLGTPSVLTSGKFSLQADLSTVNAMTLRDSGTTYGVSSYYTLYQNSAGSTVGGIGHTAVTSLGINATTDLQFFTAATERMRLDSSGNLGLGVTPSAWGSNARVLQVAGSGSVFGQTNANIVTFGGNMYWDNTNFKYIATDYASKYVQYQSQHLWFTAPSGTAGNTISFTQAMTLDASGNLLVGQTSKTTGAVSTAKLGVTAGITLTNGSYGGFMEGVNTSGTAYGYLSLGSAYNAFNAGDVGLGTSGALPLLFATNNIERARIDSSGNLGVGTTSPSQRLTIAQTNGYPVIDFKNSGTGYGDIGFQVDKMVLSAYSTTPLTFWTNSNERARIDSSGSFFVGASSLSGNAVQIYNNSNQAGRININKTTSGLFNALVNTYSGTTVGGINYDNTSTSFPTSSDVRMKKDIVDAGSASAKIDQIRIVSHGWKHDDAVVEFGVIAQELVNVAPQAVSAGDDGEEVEVTWGVDYSKLVPMLIKAHQEQQAIIQSLTARITALESA